MAFFNPNQPQGGQAPNIPNGIAGPVTPEGDDELEAALRELGLSPAEMQRIAAKQARLDRTADSVGKNPVGQVGDGHVFFDPAGVLRNVMEKRRFAKDEKALDEQAASAREREAAARARVAEKLPGLDENAIARIAANTQDESVLTALQMIRQRNAEERGNTREDKIRAEERDQRKAETAEERAYREKRDAEEREFQRSESAKDRENRRALIAAQMEGKAGKAGNPTEGERKAAALATRLESALATINTATKGDPDAARPGLMEKGFEAVGMDALANSSRSAERQQANAAQLDALDAALTLATGAAYTREQLRGQAVSYFPQIGDDPATVKSKAERFQTLINTARLQAGRSEGQIDQALPNPSAPQAPNAAPSSAPGTKTVNWSEL